MKTVSSFLIAITFVVFFITFDEAFQPMIITRPITKLSPRYSIALSQPQILPTLDVDVDLRGIQLSTLQGKALKVKEYPTLNEIKGKFPAETFQKDTLKSLSFAALDVFTTATTAAVGIKFLLPYAATLFASSFFLHKFVATIIWIFYSVVVGTCAIGMWVTAHECGHGAFSENKKLQDFIGYLFHSLMLVPYFSWQRSHAVHHANTNHIEDGETHVPPLKTNPSRHISSKVVTQELIGKNVGEIVYGSAQLILHLLVGWPAYLLFGATGGPSRGLTNHFIPVQFGRPFQSSPLKDLYPGVWKSKVFLSDIGVGAVLTGLFFLVQKYGLAWVLAAYGGPYLIVNAWLVGYTWLQHTEVDVPHLPAENFSFVKGGFHTIDRPYPQLLWGLVDFLHHHIGSTHVVHHIDSTIPHYRAKAATNIVKESYPEHYLFESTPIFSALWRIASKCFIVEKRKTKTNEDLYVFVDP